MQGLGSLRVWRCQHGANVWSTLIVALGVCLSLCLQHPLGVSGHGYLIDPPSRSSAWRVGFQSPVNYNDNELNCGGFARQWQQNGGRCGVCGDPWDVATPRPHEVGGKYAQGIIVRRYSVGQVVEVNVTITAQHGGWFEFRLCPDSESVDSPTTQECLDANLLEVVGGSSRTRYQMSSNAAKGSFKVNVKLPEDVVCSHCVLHWKWHVGNSWGVGSDGAGCLGCGAQEEFINCADISIASSDKSNDKTTPLPKSTRTTPISSTAPSRRSCSPTSSTIISRIASASSATSKNRPTARVATRTTPKIPNTTPRRLSTVTWLPKISTKRPDSECRAIGLFEGNADMDKWCVTNCALNFCPNTHCKCDQQGSEADFTGCRSLGIWKSDIMDKWCVSNCAGGYCPPDYCQC